MFIAFGSNYILWIVWRKQLTFAFEKGNLPGRQG